ncbi:hypothetical protein AB1Y20_017493 [Prymnesium parvum]|uniref:Uncharacterized protein n=1 Tax=Prymnesium parvum TaxID=97485 RepID=A0AB34JMC8_PRYPA
MDLRKRPAPAAPSEHEKQGALAKRAAIEVLQGKHNGRARDAAEAIGVRRHSLVTYYVKLWRGTELGEALAEEAPAVATPIAETRAEVPSSSVSPVLPPVPKEVEKKSKQEIRRWMIAQGARLVEAGECSYRIAVELVRSSYGIDVSLGTMHACVRSPGLELAPRGRPQVLPQEFTDRMVQWICAKRALKFPVFRDEVLAVANRILIGTTYLQKFKHHMLDVSWYYRMLKNYEHIIGTANQRPLEIDRARWATAENIKGWYDMLAQILVDANIARRNPDYDPSASLTS